MKRVAHCRSQERESRSVSYKKGDRVESNRRDPFYIKCRALHKLLVTCEFQYLVAVVDDSHSVGNEDDGLLFVEHGGKVVEQAFLCFHVEGAGCLVQKQDVTFS